MGKLVQMRTPILTLVVAVLAFGSTQAAADVYKYVDAKGNTYFTDAPLRGSKYKLQWKRESRKLVDENRERLARATRPIQSSKSSKPSKSVGERRARVSHVVDRNAQRYGLLPELLHAVIRTESAYNPQAVSHAGAQGLMQLMPGTAKRYGVRDSFDPAQNVQGGAAYLRDLLDMFDQDLRLALAGYNAGEGAVIKYGRQIPPYSETQDYVRKVLRHLWAELGSPVTSR
jgi:soluble lytic murein transglycosylase-like protein